MITMGSAPIPLPYRSWDEVPPDQLQTIESINQNTTQTETSTAVESGRSWREKTFVGIRWATIVTIILFFLKFLALAVKSGHRGGYQTNTLSNLPRLETYRSNFEPIPSSDYFKPAQIPISELRSRLFQWKSKYNDQSKYDFNNFPVNSIPSNRLNSR